MRIASILLFAENNFHDSYCHLSLLYHIIYIRCYFVEKFYNWAKNLRITALAFCLQKVLSIMESIHWNHFPYISHIYMCHYIELVALLKMKMLARELEVRAIDYVHVHACMLCLWSIHVHVYTCPNFTLWPAFLTYMWLTGWFLLFLTSLCIQVWGKECDHPS